MATLPTLYPTSLVTAGGWTDEAGGSPVATLIDDTTAGDTDYIRGVLNGSTQPPGEWDLTDTPADFASMTSLSVEIRHSRGGVEGGDNGGGDDTYNLAVSVETPAGVKIAGDTGALVLIVETGTVGYLVKTETIVFPFVDTAATKATWDGARVVLQGSFLQSMGADGDRIWVDFVRLVNGIYVSSVALPPISTVVNQAINRAVSF